MILIRENQLEWMRANGEAEFARRVTAHLRLTVPDFSSMNPAELRRRVDAAIPEARTYQFVTEYEIAAYVEYTVGRNLDPNSPEIAEVLGNPRLDNGLKLGWLGEHSLSQVSFMEGRP